MKHGLAEALNKAPKLANVLSAQGDKTDMTASSAQEWLAIKASENAIIAALLIEGDENATSAERPIALNAPFTLIRNSLEKMGFSSSGAFKTAERYVDVVAQYVELEFGTHFPWRTKAFEETKLDNQQIFDSIQADAERARMAELARWEAITIFYHRLAHDVRKPLRDVLYPYLDQLRETQDEPTRSETTAVMNRVKELQELIYSGASTSIEDMRAQAIQDARSRNVEELLNDAYWLWKMEARNFGGKKVLEPVSNPSSLEIRSNIYLIGEVLENLVSNALRMANSTVEVAASEATEDNKRGVIFTVTDDGPGMKDPSVKTYDPLSMPSNPKSGLGLPLSDFIVTRLLDGSHLRFEQPAQRNGTSVSFFVPEVCGLT
jgi:signal transduction histidine kinase